MILLIDPKYPDYPKKDFVQLPDTTEDEITLTLLIEALARFKKPAEIKLFISCSGVYFAITTGRIQLARSKGFVNSKGQPSKNAALWDILIAHLRTHKWSITQEEHSYSEWMRSELKKWHSQ